MKTITYFIISLLLLNITIPAYAFSESVKETYVLEVEKPILISEKNQILNAFSPEEHNLDMTIGIILSIVPSFGVGHFWLGNTEAGYFFLNLDLIMLAIPLVIAIVSMVFASFTVTSTEPNTMQSSTNIFNILGIIAWASSLGVKVWETASVWKYISKLRKADKNKVTFSNNGVQVSLLSF